MSSAISTASAPGCVQSAPDARRPAATIPHMASAAFDMFKAASALESAGVERAQAEAIAEAIQQRQSYAKRPQVARLGSAARVELRELRAELRADMAALEMRLTNRMYVGAIGLAALVAAFGLFT